MPELKRKSAAPPQKTDELSPERRYLIRQLVRREVQEALVPIHAHLKGTEDALSIVATQLEEQGRDLGTVCQEVDFLRSMIADLLEPLSISPSPKHPQS
jgi:hypothetical protein